MMTRRAVTSKGENILLNRDVIFESEKAFLEFEHFVRLEGFDSGDWLRELKQIVQIHLAYKMILDNANVQIIFQILNFQSVKGTDFAQFLTD